MKKISNMAVGPILILTLLMGTATSSVGSSSYAAVETAPMLESLSVSTQSEPVKPESDAHIYSVTVPTATQSLQLKISTKSKLDWVIIDGVQVPQGVMSPAISIKESSQWIDIQLISPDGKLTSQYRLLVGRALSDNSSLKEILVGGQKAVYNSERQSYQVNLPANAQAVPVTLKLQDANGKVFYNDQIIEKGQIVLDPKTGPNLYEFIAVAESGEQTIHRLAIFVEEPKSNTEIKSFTVNAGGKITSGSAKDLEHMVITANSDAKGIQVTVGPADLNAVVKINGTAITANKSSSLIYVPIGKSNIELSVTAEDGVTVKNVLITVEKSAVQNAIKAVKFTDLANHPYEKSVMTLANLGILSGTSGSLFKPNQTITQAEFSAIMAKAFGLSPQSKLNIEGLKAKDWYANSVYACNDATEGALWSGSVFKANAPVTKAEALTQWMTLYNLQIVQSGAVSALAEDQYFDFSNAPAVAMTRAEAGELVYKLLVALKWVQ